MKVLRLIFVVGSQIALCATVTWAQEGDVDTRQPISIQLFEAVPQTDSSEFRANTDSRFQMQTERWDRVPYHFAPFVEGRITIPRNYRAVLSGDPTGTSSFRIDNFIVLEFDGLRPLLIGNMEPVQMTVATPIVVNSSCFNCQPTDVDLAPYLPKDVPLNFGASALDYGGVAYISDVYLVLLPKEPEEPLVVEFEEPLEHFLDQVTETINMPLRLEHVHADRGGATVVIEEPLEYIAPPRETETVVVEETLEYFGIAREPITVRINDPLEFLGRESETRFIDFSDSLVFDGTTSPTRVQVPQTLVFTRLGPLNLHVQVPEALQFTRQTTCGQAWPEISSNFIPGSGSRWDLDGGAEPIYSEDGIAAGDTNSDSMWFWVAPNEFLGDKSENFGAYISFNLRVSESRLDDADFNLVPVIYIEGSGITLSAAAYSPGTEWSSYCFNLDQSGLWNVDGTSRHATEGEIRQVLSNINSIKIRGAFTLRSEMGWLGHVEMGRAN